MTQPFTEDYRNKIGYQLTLRLAQAIKNKEIGVVEAPFISKQILNNIDKINSHDEMVAFLTKLVEDWPFFSNILTLELSEEEEKISQEKIKEIQQLLRDGKIDEVVKEVDKVLLNENN